MCCSLLQRVAACESYDMLTMQSQWCSTATTTGTYLMCCSVLQRDAECESYDMLIDAVAVVQYCNNYRQQLQVHIQRVAACCSVLQRVTACCSVLQSVSYLIMAVLAWRGGAEMKQLQV